MQKLSVNIFNTNIVEDTEPTFNLSWDDIKKSYETLFLDSPLDEVNIVFVESEYIQDLNKQYRDIDAPTDVLSFQFTEDEKLGEIYISPEYVYKSFQGNEYEEEILRLIIHGTLHILGHDHKESLNDSPDEEMFVLQEKLLLKMLKACS